MTFQLNRLASKPRSFCHSPLFTSGSLPLSFLVPPLRDAIICLIYSKFRIGVVSENAAPPCAAVASIVFRRLIPPSSVSSDPIGNGGSGVVGRGPFSSVRALSSSSPSDERSRFPARRSLFFSLLVSVFSVCYVLLDLCNPILQSSSLRMILAAHNQ